MKRDVARAKRLPATLSCFNLTCSCTLIRLRLNEGDAEETGKANQTRPDCSLFLPTSGPRPYSLSPVLFSSSLLSLPLLCPYSLSPVWKRSLVLHGYWIFDSFGAVILLAMNRRQTEQAFRSFSLKFCCKLRRVRKTRFLWLRFLWSGRGL